MATIVLNPAHPLGPQIDAAAEGDTIILPAGSSLPTKKVTFQVEAAPPAPSPLVLTLVVNGVVKATESASPGDVIEMRVSS
jgi:hypothetical protein